MKCRQWMSWQHCMVVGAAARALPSLRLRQLHQRLLPALFQAVPVRRVQRVPAGVMRPALPSVWTMIWASSEGQPCEAPHAMRAIM